MSNRQPDSEASKTVARRRWRLARVLAIAVAALLALYAGLMAIAPFLISNGVVRNAMEQTVSEWTGHRTTIAGRPEISFWPEPRITLTSVTISKPGPQGETVLGRIERLSASFGVFQAILGRPVFRDFRFTRPEFFINRDEPGRLDWAGSGLLSAAIRQAEAGTNGRQMLADALDAGIGRITISDGSLAFADAIDGKSLSLASINATIAWPRLSEGIKISATASERDKTIGLDLSSDTPLLLLGGKDASISMTLRLAGLTGRFDGSAKIAPDYYLSGPLRLDAPDFVAFLNWSGLQLRGLEGLKKADIRADVSTVAGSFRLDDLSASFDDSNATGILELTPPGTDKAKISGTLAFDQIDGGNLLDAFSLLPGPAGGDDAARETASLQQWLDFDLTLSAGKATLPYFTLEDMAATIIARGDQQQFQIADSRFEGGSLTARLDNAQPGKDGQLQLSAKNVDLSGIIDRLQLAGPLPHARASADLSLDFAKPVRRLGPDDLAGHFRFQATAGELRPFNLEGIRELAGERPYFRLSEAGSGSLDFDRIVFAARIHGSSSEIDEAFIESGDQTLRLTGIVPYASNGLALSAELVGDDKKSRDLTTAFRVFVAGSWPDPIISPMFPKAARP